MNKNSFVTIILCVALLSGIVLFVQKNSTRVETLDYDGVISTATSSSMLSTAKVTEATFSENTLPANNNLMHMITIETNHGNIVFETYDKDAPKTVENFITLANKGFYSNVIFHRVISGFMIQGGDPTGTGSGGPGYKFADELDPSTESFKNGYKKGVVAMANSGPNTNGSQFFIMLSDYALPNLYTIFGKVVSGQDVVDAIGKVATNANDRPIEDVMIKKVTVENTR